MNGQRITETNKNDMTMSFILSPVPLLALLPCSPYETIVTHPWPLRAPESPAGLEVRRPPGHPVEGVNAKEQILH